VESVTKTRISPETVEILAQRAFPGCVLTQVRELTEGMFNTAYRITGSGIPENGVILKAGPSAGTKVLTYEKDILKTEVAVYRLLEQTKVPAPRVLFADYSRECVPCDYFFMTCIPGILWKNADEALLRASRPSLMEELGRINREIHSVVGTHYGYIKEDPGFQYDSWPDAFGGMVRDICEDGRKDGLTLPYDRILELVSIHSARLEEVTVPRLVDFDLWAGNVLLGQDENGYKINGIIDFERAFFGDSLGDFISAVMIYDHVEVESDFIRGYGSTIVMDESARIRMDLYRLYLALIMYVETYRYEEAYADQTKGWLSEMIGELMARLSA